ncbi:hypothetical protein M501DRAFT_1015973 [Patellaria atrata CBS 101060]|uniref:MACPF-like domain-containing protein n=1 Tax=Patellaria atrata CBS 101060 TaxID=1346257 RepID=A0A9P4SCE0_9PEZI|nr:hypothetical protein M501DRAFT_1015973 [Patellaria atrata CBS 101060]
MTKWANPAVTYSRVVKVVQFEREDEGKAVKVLATVPIAEVRDGKLQNLRAKLGSTVTDEHKFCYPDGSPAAETLPLTEYIEHVDEDLDPDLLRPQRGNDSQSTKRNKPIERKVYMICPSPKSEESSQPASSVLEKGDFLLNVLEWEIEPQKKGEISEKEGVLRSRGTVQSTTLGEKKIVDVTLAGLRKKLAKSSPMSLSSRLHKFCTSTGVTVTDETMTFSSYLKLDAKEVSKTAPIASVTVVYKRDSAMNQPAVDMSKLPGAYDPDKPTRLNENAFEGGKKAKTFDERKDRSWGVDDELLRLNSAPDEPSAAGLTEKDWPLVISQCGLMYGWVVDRVKNEITRAPRPAFRLRPKGIVDPVASIPDFLRDIEPKGTDALSNPAQPARSADEKAVSSPKPALKTSDNSDYSNDASNEDEDEGNSEEGSQKKKIWPRIPTFVVNDDSKVEITLVSHEFEHSLAKNDFSNSSTEGSMSGGYAGFAVSVSAGYAKSKSESSVNTTNNFKKTMVAKYLFPRADILLHAEDLEPSPELTAALQTIATTKNVNDMRKLQREFGQLFCQRVTVGGRLQSTRIMDAKSTMSEQEQKEQYKVSVGLQVSTPIGVGAGVKHEQEKGKSVTVNTTNIDKSETHVFEAVGGETILASSPSIWAPSVAKFKNWRVIKRDSLSPLIDVIAALPGYAAIKRLFIQAVPTLSKYIAADSSREMFVRLRVSTPLTQLSLSYTKKAVAAKGQPNPVYYLGHSPFAKVTPSLMGIKDPNKFWDDLIEYPNDQVLFSPQSYRAPVILGYPGDRADFSSRLNQSFTDTVWSITTPFSEHLQHGSKVIIKTKPQETKPVAKDPAKPETLTTIPAIPASLIVFRNAQGVFLPGMSSSDETHYWRILKVDGKRYGENIKEGDAIRLCWIFQDQTVGFRDFKEDVFGRRRAQIPPELKNGALFMKLPWPRFENIATPKPGQDPVPNTMLMSTQATQGIAFEDLATLPAISSSAVGKAMYAIQDVSFRVDVVANGGQGDTGDYLLQGLSQEQGKSDADAFKALTEKQRTIVASQKLVYEMFFLECQRL